MGALPIWADTVNLNVAPAAAKRTANANNPDRSGDFPSRAAIYLIIITVCNRISTTNRIPREWESPRVKSTFPR